ncbi:hypothetical protein INR49_001622 [Caranx melampygus]|nr:hypothetical protein INR49_001622 [Caranx melampygus]
MNLIKSKGHIMRYVLIGLLVCEAISQAVCSPEEELAALKLRFSSLKNRYKQLCNKYSDLASNCSAPGLTCTECPPEWFQVGDKCFHMRTDKREWLKSEQDCEEAGGHLASLTTREEHEAVEKESRRIGSFYTHYWIGLNDIQTEGEWKWVDKSNLTHPFWDRLNAQEPDNNQSGGPEGEDCVVVDSHSQTWSDVPCTFLYPRICEMDAVPLA